MSETLTLFTVLFTYEPIRHYSSLQLELITFPLNFPSADCCMASLSVKSMLTHGLDGIMSLRLWGYAVEIGDCASYHN